MKVLDTLDIRDEDITIMTIRDYYSVVYRRVGLMCLQTLCLQLPALLHIQIYSRKIHNLSIVMYQIFQ
jgi:hypothetical protein